MEEGTYFSYKSLVHDLYHIKWNVYPSSFILVRRLFRHFYHLGPT